MTIQCECGYANDLRVESMNFADLGGTEDWAYYVMCPGCRERGPYRDSKGLAIEAWAARRMTRPYKQYVSSS